MSRYFLNSLYLIAVFVLTLVVWLFIPWVFGKSIGAFITHGNFLYASLIDVGIGLAIITTLLVANMKINRLIFKRHWTRWLYILPFVALVILAFRTNGFTGNVFGNAAWLYVVVMLTSVFMQQYVTFGLAQSYVRKNFHPL